MSDPLEDMQSQQAQPGVLRAISPTPPSGLAWTTMQVAQRAAAAAVVVVLSPLLALIVLAIVLESGRPAIFVQPRFGKGGRPFPVLKFRTMKLSLGDVSGARQTADRDPRITRVGHILRRSSLDELPQLLNVVAGQMMLIGPRAHPCGMRVEGILCEDLDPRYHDRHVVAPGITGWAQVNGSRGAVKSAELLRQRVSLDLHYISNWSMAMDFRVLLKTLRVVASGKDAR